MIGKNEVNKIIKYVDERMMNFCALFNKYKNNIEEDISNKCSLLNERTLAVLSNQFISEILNSDYDKKLLFYINEFKIMRLENINEEEKQIFLPEVNLTTVDKNWKNCYVDGFFCLNDFYFPNTKNYLFIEYKLQKKLGYAELATDYLKYKLYTKNSENNTIFAYVLFKKKDNYPSIIVSNDRYYSMLEKEINEEVLETSGVYLYVSNDNKQNDNLEEMYEEFDSISKKVNEIEKIGIEKFKLYSEEEVIFLENINRYNANVVKASLIRENYRFLYEVWNKSKEKFKDDEIIGKLNFDDRSKENLLKLISEGSAYNSFFEQNIYIDKKVEAIKNGLKATYFSSFNMIVLIDFFKELFNIDCGNPKYFTLRIGKGKRKNIINYYDVAKDKKNELNRIYADTDDGKNKIKKLAMELLFYLVNVYPLIYEISNEKKEVIGVSKNSRIHENLKNIQKGLNVIKRKTKFKGDLNIKSLDDGDDKKIADLVTHVMRLY